MKTPRSAFTLMEMLVVVALLGTLAGIGAAGMRAADNMAREQRTRATLAKVNRFLMEKYASYQYRRIEMPTMTGTKQELQKERLKRLRQLQISEMPCQWDEVNGYSPYRLRRAKDIAQRNTNQTGGAANDTWELCSAELLYQIVMGMPEAEEAFNGLEVADTDGNGLNEFIDGWGTPIFYIRWPAGYVNTEEGANVTYPVISKLQTSIDIRDPFDPNNWENGYAVFPLIYSCGPDRMRGMNMGASGSAPCVKLAIGAPEAQEYFDNITNHNL
ncbi:MAG: prepilin-type N-terminal cleavage/methylation domain-containing protein [Planctomycetia bacterium]|nr:prepilin-type N-terminal cleavage/methylation domain-containing protein [Planctomycetia bacterium]